MADSIRFAREAMRKGGAAYKIHTRLIDAASELYLKSDEPNTNDYVIAKARYDAFAQSLLIELGYCDDSGYIDSEAWDALNEEQMAETRNAFMRLGVYRD